MIYQAQITDPLDWLQSVKQDEKALQSSMHPTDADNFSYELSTVNLENRTFYFKPGLNVIVGPNGSGKSSLINLLASVFGCVGEMSSCYSKDMVAKTFSTGIFSCCKVKANYDISTFNFTPPSKARITGVGESLANGLNRLKTHNKSDGQAEMLSLENLLHYFRTDGKLMHGDQTRNLLNLHLNYLDPIEEYHKSHPTPMMDCVSDYYRDNHDATGTAVTFLMDTPDDHVDIPNQRLLFKLFLQAINEPDKYQFIVSLNSLLLIQSLLPIKEIHWIDLNKGYLQSVANIGTFCVSNRKEESQKQQENKQAPDKHQQGTQEQTTEDKDTNMSTSPESAAKETNV